MGAGRGPDAGPAISPCCPGRLKSHWNWTARIDVSHLYLSDSLMARVASDMQGKEVTQVHLHDVLHGSDPVVTHIGNEIMREAMERCIGGPLYVEALAVQLAVQLLRGYASCVFKTPADGAACREGRSPGWKSLSMRIFKTP